MAKVELSAMCVGFRAGGNGFASSTERFARAARNGLAGHHKYTRLSIEDLTKVENTRKLTIYARNLGFSES